MQKRLLLISNSTNYGEPYLEYTHSELKKFLGPNVKSVLFIPYAGISISWNEYFSKVENVFNNLGYNISSIHHKDNPVKAVENAEAIIVGGGNTFNLVYHIHKSGIIQIVRQKVAAGTPYVGWSAGSVAACPSLKTTNDMPIINPESFECFNLIPFQINPHYTDFIQPNHSGESREQRLMEFLELNKEIDLLGLRESTMLLIEGKTVTLIGRKPTHLMRYNEKTIEFNHGDNLNFLMK